MTIVEVFFPSGYVVDNNPIIESIGTNPIHRTETPLDGTSVNVYYNHVGIENNCFLVTAFRRRKVVFMRPAYVVVRALYNHHWRAIQEYEVDERSVCDICDGDDCPDECLPWA